MALSLEPSTAPPTCMPSNCTERRVGERPSHGDATCLVRTRHGEDERRQSTRGTRARTTAVRPAIMTNKKDVPGNPKCAPRPRRQGGASVSASPRWLQKRKGVTQWGPRGPLPANSGPAPSWCPAGRSPAGRTGCVLRPPGLHCRERLIIRTRSV